jgi:hypothetical protein
MRRNRLTDPAFGQNFKPDGGSRTFDNLDPPSTCSRGCFGSLRSSITAVTVDALDKGKQPTSAAVEHQRAMPSRSCMLAGCTATFKSRPRVSTSADAAEDLNRAAALFRNDHRIVGEPFQPLLYGEEARPAYDPSALPLAKQRTNASRTSTV